MLGRHDPLDNIFSLRVAVEPVVQLGLGDVVRLDDSLLSVRVRAVFPQHTHASRLDHVRVDAVVDDQFDKGGVVVQRPSHGGGEHLVGIGIQPLIV